MGTDYFIKNLEETPIITTAILGTLFLLAFWVFTRFLFSDQNPKTKNGLSPPPVVPGLPVLGNLLQLKEKKPHKTFTKWAETYGPVYSIKTGASTVVVLNTNDVAKEAMISRHASISTRKLTSALTMLTSNKTMVATSDYNDFHRMVKRYLLTNVLGAAAQKRHRCHRDAMLDNISTFLHDHVKNNPLQAVDFRHIFESELFGLSMKQALGRDVQSLYVEELGKTLSRDEIFKVLVSDFMEGAIEVDWRDFFPYLKWVPNKSMESKIQHICFARRVVMKALIAEEKKRFDASEKKDCFLDYLLHEADTLTEDQIAMLVWEEIIEVSDTTLVTTEWAMYVMAKDPNQQLRLLQELRTVCGLETLKEEKLSQLPYLNAIFHETLRKYCPVPIIPLRYVHEDTELGGHFIAAGTEIAINIYGCNMDKKRWENPEEFNPERFRTGEKYDTQDFHKTMSFGAGKRACAGSLQASLISCAAIGRFVQEFEWQLKQGEVENVDIVGLTARKLKPLHVMLKARVN